MCTEMEREGIPLLASIRSAEPACTLTGPDGFESHRMTFPIPDADRGTDSTYPKEHGFLSTLPKSG
jgi:hypothetical protein